MRGSEWPGRPSATSNWRAGTEAGHWDDTLGPVTREAIAPLLDAVEAASGVRLLDIACGTGALAAAAAGRGTEVVGMDFAPTMVAEAAGRTRRRVPGRRRRGDSAGRRQRGRGHLLLRCPAHGTARAGARRGRARATVRHRALRDDRVGSGGRLLRETVASARRFELVVCLDLERQSNKF